MLAPGAVIGIVGGGQLGRMTAMAAARLGYRCHILAPEADCPASHVSAVATIAGYEDQAALDRFAASVDVVTIEFENIPVATLERLATARPCRPGPEVLAICQDRAREKSFLRAIGAPVTAFHEVGSPGDVAQALEAIGSAAVLKTARLGYDGKGQSTLTSDDDVADAWQRIGGRRAVLEAHVDFACEISVVTARGLSGEAVSYPPVENRHRNHILAETIAPAPIAGALAQEAVALAERIAEALDLVGLLAVEMFVTRAGDLLVNELAPRPHNSGHWTIDAAAISQFELLVRAICGLPLVDPGPFRPAVMQNLLGDDVEHWPRILAEPGARLHLYGKAEARPGRKMGHVTRLQAAGSGDDVRKP